MASAFLHPNAVNAKLRVNTRRWSRQMKLSSETLSDFVDAIQSLDARVQFRVRVPLNDAPRKFAELPDEVMGEHLAPAVRSQASETLSKAKRLTPVDTGFLRSTGRVSLTEVNERTVEAELSFNTDYAIFVHEILENKHPVGQAKFLEAPVKADAPDFAKAVGKELVKRLKEVT